MRVIFMGTGEIGLPALQALMADPRHVLAGVVTQPDKAVGRKQIVTPPKVKSLALAQGLPVAQPKRVRNRQALDVIASWQGEVIVVMAYGQLLPPALLETPSMACLNLHASLLPRHRGAAPIQAAIREGDRQSGITVMFMAEGLDTGDILLQRSFDLASDETGGTLHDRLAQCAPGALAEALDLLAAGEAPRVPQDETLATYAGKLTREDGIIDWTQPAETIERLLRAYDPWPGTLTFLGGEGTYRRLKIFPPAKVIEGRAFGPPGAIHPAEDGSWIVATGVEALRISEIQLEGKRRMTVAEFSQGHEMASGTRFCGP